MKHRLIIHSGLEAMTREETRGYLEAIQFTIPVVEPVLGLYHADRVPAMPARYTGPKTLLANGTVTYHPDYLAWLAQRDAAYNTYQSDMERYRQDMADIEAILGATFTGLETYQVVGTDKSGLAVWDWVENTPPRYRFSQCAMVLASKRPTDVIGFICDGFFGS
jgi:hypothetical protein